MFQTNYENFNFIKMWRTTENSTGLYFDLPGNVINLNNKYYMYKRLGKNLNFVLTIKNFNKKLLDEEMNDFYRRIEMKVHFRDNTKVKEQTNEDIFKKPINKKCVPYKYHYRSEKNRVDDALKNNLSKK